MKKLTKLFKKALLWLITAFIPVVVAACYGMMYSFDTSGKVIDKDTREGIDGIEVKCIVDDKNDVEDIDVTFDGEFMLAFDRQCKKLVFEDFDGKDNGGYYCRLEIRYENYDPSKPVVMKKQ